MEAALRAYLPAVHPGQSIGVHATELSDSYYLVLLRFAAVLPMPMSLRRPSAMNTRFAPGPARSTLAIPPTRCALWLVTSAPVVRPPACPDARHRADGNDARR